MCDVAAFYYQFLLNQSRKHAKYDLIILYITVFTDFGKFVNNDVDDTYYDTDTGDTYSNIDSDVMLLTLRNTCILQLLATDQTHRTLY